MNFEHAKFNGAGVSFVNASFKADEVNFKRVNFGRAKVKFNFAEFGDGAKLFERIHVNGALFDFRRVMFGSGKVDFRRAMFGTGFVTFEESEIKEGKLTFRMAHFEGGDLSFRRTDFGKDEANFDHADFNNRSITFEGSIASLLSISNSFVRGNLDLRIKKADKIDLSHSYLYSITDLNFLKQESLHVLSLSGVRNLGKIIINWKQNDVKNLIERSTLAEEEKANQFNILKSNFSTNGQYNDEDHAYVYFKRHEHRHLKKKALENSSPMIKPFIRLGYAFRFLVFDKMGLYATNPSRVMLSMIVAIFFFAAIYILFHLLGIGHIINSVDASDNLNVIDKSLYHSAITFFTIGYGDFYPTSFSRLISALEGWTGVFLMSYFTVAFVRKILR
ncbi:MAG: two pore domain potassium channel family protein [Crocinitomicaceae bacterium]|nr:two pore domain potassium channel family protein [Crocinitomicaceae bacterium]